MSLGRISNRHGQVLPSAAADSGLTPRRRETSLSIGDERKLDGKIYCRSISSGRPLGRSVFLYPAEVIGVAAGDQSMSKKSARTYDGCDNTKKGQLG